MVSSPSDVIKVEIIRINQLLSYSTGGKPHCKSGTISRINFKFQAVKQAVYFNDK